MENNNKNEIEDFEKMISNKTKNFFEKNVKLTKDTLPQYLEYIGLINFWNTQKEKDYFWSVLEKYSKNNELTLEETLNGIHEFFIDEEENSDDNSSSKKQSSNNEQNIILKYLDNLDIEKIKEIRTILINLKFKDKISIIEIEEEFKKYKFIHITKEEMIQFLQLFCNQENNNLNKVSLIINFEIYSQIMVTLEKKLLENNNIFIQEDKGLNYEINDNPIDMIEDLINIEEENYYYVKILIDTKNILLNMKEEICNNYEKMLLNSEEKLKENILSCDNVFNGKIQGLENFIKNFDIICHKKENKLQYLKNLISSLKSKYEDLKNEYINYQQFINEGNYTVDMEEQINKLIEENNIITQQYENKNNEIKNMKKEINEKDNELNSYKIQNLENINENKNKIREIEKLKIDNKNLKESYDQLVNQILIKIKEESNNKINQQTIENKVSNNEEERIIVNDEKKLYSLNYEQLLIYTSELDKSNQLLNNKINSLSELIEKHKEKISELKKQLNIQKENYIILQSQNSNLKDKIEDLNKDIEINKLFRPSNMLNQIRLSRLSNFNNNNNDNRNSNILYINPKNAQKEDNPFEINNNFNDNYKNRESQLSKIDVDTIQINDSKENSKKLENDINKNEVIKSEIYKENSFDKEQLEKNAAIIITSKKNMISKATSTDFINNYFHIEKTNVLIKKEEITQKNIISIEHFYDILSEDKEIKKNFQNLEKIQNNTNFIDNNRLNIYNESFHKIEDNNKRESIKNQDHLSINEHMINSIDKIKYDKKSLSFISQGSSDNILYKNSLEFNPYELDSFSRNPTNILDNEKKDNILNKERTDSSLLKHKTINEIIEIFKEKKIPKILSYDFLTLRQSEEIISLLDKYNDNSTSYEIFSDDIFLIKGNYEKTKRILYITSSFIYILDKLTLQIRKIFEKKNLEKLTISIKNCNMIAFHFKGKEDIVIEILRRLELLYYFRDIINLKGEKLLFKYSDEFNVKMDGVYFTMIARASDNTIAQNFQNSIKFNYLYKLTPGFFNYGRTFKEKLVVLSDVGLLYFDDPSSPPKKLIPINGAEIKKIDDNVYKRKYCFEIKCLNKQNFIFAAKSEVDLNDWLSAIEKLQETYSKNKVEVSKKD